LRVVASSHTLGVTFSDFPSTPYPWAERVAAVEDTLGRVACLPLSTFGRAFAASGYALSRSLYHAEFAGLPTGPQLNRLRQTTTALVDRALSPAAYTANPHARLVGVGAACMPPPPALGGFSLLPLVEHVRGRHAALAARCLTGACPGLGSFQPPWALVALALLHHIHHAATPLCLLTARVLPAQGARHASILVLGRPVPSTCPALIQLASAFSALPPPLILPSPALEPGPWCFNMPLWGNPFLPGATAGQSLEADFADLAGIRGFNTVGMAVRCCAAMTALLLTAPITPPGQPVNPAVARHLTLAYHATVLRGILQVEPAALPPALRSFPTALARFIALHPRLPPAWCAAAGVVANVPGGAAAAPAAPVVWSLLLRHLGWRLGTTRVWDVVCLAALSAMEYGRRLLYRRRPLVGAAPLNVQRVSAESVGDFWARLCDFAAMGRPPRGWGEVPLVHPFLAASSAGDVVFCRPPDVDSPPPSPEY
ncbi:hypothetical protein TSOC_002792, partial [Tetrabaena socialis]